jgi:pimeloyl-ACP methyl ester carboxylesterase
LNFFLLKLQMFRLVPWFDDFFVEPFAKNNLTFESDKHIANINVPITILHAEDDKVVPFHLGKQVCIQLLFIPNFMLKCI